MATRLLETEDESGRTWMIYEGDMAWNLCHALSRIGLTKIVLPNSVFRSGVLPAELPDYGLASFSVEMVKDEFMAGLYRRLARLSDCLAWLLKNPMEASAALV